MDRISLDIIKLRKKHGLSRKELAERLSFSYARLSKYETGERKLSLELVILLAREFNLSLDEMLSFPCKKNSENMEFLELYSSLDDSKKECVINFLRVLNE